MRTEVKTGLLLFAATMTLNCIVGIPHFVMGFLLLLAVGLEIVGALPEKTYSGIKKLKKTLFHKI